MTRRDRTEEYVDSHDDQVDERRDSDGTHDSYDGRYDRSDQPQHEAGYDRHDEEYVDHRTDAVDPDARRREEFGGVNWGASFFGWLIAVAVAVLLSSIVGAVTAAVGANLEVSTADAEGEAGTVGIVAAGVVLLVLVVSYYAGGYVAGRMSRFDGAKQGAAVWLLGLLLTLLAGGLGLLFGSQYDVLARIELPTLGISADTLTLGGVIAVAVILLGTLLAAMGGGKVGQRYHHKVDRAGYPY